MDSAEMWEKARHVWKTGAYELNRLEQYLDTETFAECVRVLGETTGRIATAGVGTSGAAAIKIAHSLSCIERPAFFLSPGDAVHGRLGQVQPGDVAILVSKGGGSREVVNMLPALETKQAYIIGVTENADSVLAQHSNLHVDVKIEAEADEFNMLATTSTMAVIAYFDAVCIALMDYTNYSKEQFAVIHPGGAVGERLLGGGG
jgi:D-arabinose 5-phosphate isomerase GutQ